MANEPHRVLVAAAQAEDGIPTVILGMPKAAWDYCQNGKTHTFDLTQIGLPVRIFLFGGKDHEELKAWLEAHAAAVESMPDNLPILGEDDNRKPN